MVTSLQVLVVWWQGVLNGKADGGTRGDGAWLYRSSSSLSSLALPTLRPLE